MIVARRHGIWLAISAAAIASAGFNNPVRADEQTEKALMEQLRIMQQRMDELSKEVKELKKGTGAAAEHARTTSHTVADAAESLANGAAGLVRISRGCQEVEVGGDRSRHRPGQIGRPGIRLHALAGKIGL